MPVSASKPSCPEIVRWIDDGAIVSIVAGRTDDVAGTHWFEVTSGDFSGFVAGQYQSAPAA